MPVPPPPSHWTFRGPRRAGLLAAISALALSACATIPPAAPARIAKTPTAYETRASLAAPAAEWPGDRWWSAYGDAQLDGLIAGALAGSPTLAAARARVRRAEAAAAQAHAAQLPTVSPAPRRRS